MPPKLRSIAPVVSAVAALPVRLPPKAKESIYGTPEFRWWRAQVVKRAGGRCEALDRHGHRCSKAAPWHRMYADHIVELRDDGAPFDLNNGCCLCASHHQIKTGAVRKIRLQSSANPGGWAKT